MIANNSRNEWRAVAESLEIRDALVELQRFNALAVYRPYPYQQDFHRARAKGGGHARQRLLMAGNRVGKTVCGGRETAMHATGRYPDWWTGVRLERPSLIWVGGVNNDKVRDIGQAQLCGKPHDPDAFGTAAIPKECFVGKPIRKPGVPNAYDAVVVRHKGGFNVTLAFKAYEAGKDDWMGEAVDFIWLDEEPPQDIFGQALARTVDTHGFLIMTFTPENGMTEVVASFINDLKDGQALFRATWDDAPHLTPEAREQILSAMPEHEREMRSRGEPTLGSGLVFPVRDEDIACPVFDIPKTWPRGNGIDFGWDHPTAVAFLAYDRQTDTLYVYDAYKASKVLPPIVAEVIKAKGRYIKTFWPRDGLQKDKGSGISLSEQYRDLGVTMHPEHFKNPPTADAPKGNEAVEPGLMDMLTRMQTGRLKVFDHLAAWFEEKRGYHRKDGVLVKLNDDLMSATRYGAQSRRLFTAAEPEPATPFAIGSLGPDYDPYDSMRR